MRVFDIDLDDALGWAKLRLLGDYVGTDQLQGQRLYKKVSFKGVWCE